MGTGRLGGLVGPGGGAMGLTGGPTVGLLLTPICQEPASVGWGSAADSRSNPVQCSSRPRLSCCQVHFSYQTLPPDHRTCSQHGAASMRDA